MYHWQTLTNEEMKLAYDVGRDVIESEMANNHTGNNPLSKYAGYVGQIAAMKHLSAINVDDYQYDLEYNGKRLEVKTKIRNYTPRAGYKFCVYATNANQLCDAYVFCQVTKNPQDNSKLLHGAYVVGWISREDYNERFYFMPANEPDADDENYKSKADCFKIDIADLRPIKTLHEA